MSGVKKKRGRPKTASLKGGRRSGFLGGLLGFDDRLLAFDIALTTLFVFSFIVLFSHIVFTLFAGCDFVSAL